MTEWPLVPHAAAGGAPALTLRARLERAEGGGALRVQYRLSGELTRVRIPAAARAARVDRLWEHTCFELFAAGADRQRYVELNFSPSTEWAAYAFDSYREGMRPLELAAPPALVVERSADELGLTVDVALGAALDAQWPWRVGLSAVVEDTAGGQSFWALRHSRAKPDFHAAADWVWCSEA